MRDPTRPTPAWQSTFTPLMPAGARRDRCVEEERRRTHSQTPGRRRARLPAQRHTRYTSLATCTPRASTARYRSPHPRPPGTSACPGTVRRGVAVPRFPPGCPGSTRYCSTRMQSGGGGSVVGERQTTCATLPAERSLRPAQPRHPRHLPAPRHPPSLRSTAPTWAQSLTGRAWAWGRTGPARTLPPPPPWATRQTSRRTGLSAGESRRL